MAESEPMKDLSHDDIELCRQGRIIESFLNSTASQLTYIGLASLHQKLRERQLAVFFRNNHFSSLFRYDNSLYLLVTDLGYQNEPGVVWERLDAIDGLVTTNYTTYERHCVIIIHHHHTVNVFNISYAFPLGIQIS